MDDTHTSGYIDTQIQLHMHLDTDIETHTLTAAK